MNDIDFYIQNREIPKSNRIKEILLRPEPKIEPLPKGITVNDVLTIPVLKYYIVGFIFGFLIALVHTNILLSLVLVVLALGVFYYIWRNGKGGKV